MSVGKCKRLVCRWVVLGRGCCFGWEGVMGCDAPECRSDIYRWRYKKLPREVSFLRAIYLNVGDVLEFCLDGFCCFFVAGLFEESKHVALVVFNAGLVEGVYFEDVA